VSGPTSEYPAIALIELASIARGIAVCDVLIKKAAIRLVQSTTTHPGKYMILFRGGVGEVEASLKAGLAASGDALIDHLLLPNPHPQLEQVLEGPRLVELESLGILESFSIAGTIRAADAALKTAEIEARQIRLADHIGGKGYFVFSGLLHDVEAAMDAAVDALGPGLLAGLEIVANPHPDLVMALS
jgi:microcompartment protein CcmL/EutN